MFWQKSSCEHKRRWKTLRKRHTAIFFVVCFLVAVKIVWFVHDDVRSQTDEKRLFFRRDYLNKLNISGYLRANTDAHSTWRNVTSRLTYRSLTSSPSLAGISCPALFSGDKQEQEKALSYMDKHSKPSVPDEEYIYLTHDCDDFTRRRGYSTQPLSGEEAAFPLAFSILMYKDVQQVERLLRAIYMPQNYYCVHIDLRADDKVHLAMRSIARCFPNVFIASRLEEVFWGHISIMRAEMNCMRDLIHYDWKYFINLSGQMFPLHTNHELVKILKIFNGANDVEGSYDRSRVFWMAARQWFSWRLIKPLDTMMITIYPKGDPPHNVTIYKGSNQVAITKDFALYFLNSKISRDIYDWFSDTLAPDEYIWPTLNHNPHLKAPGSYKGNPETKPFISRASIWLPIADQVNWSWEHWDCQGKWVREICIFGVGDLPWLHNRPELFANKFHKTYQWLAYDCMEELHYNRTRFASDRTFTGKYYENLPFVRNPRLITRADETDDVDIHQ